MIATPASLRSDFIHIVGMAIHIAPEPTDHITGIRSQGRIEKKLAARHLHEGSLVLYDVSSSYYEGQHCPLAQYGHDRDGQKEIGRAHV